MIALAILIPIALVVLAACFVANAKDKARERETCRRLNYAMRQGV